MVLALALLPATVRVSRVPLLDPLVQGFSSFFRGTPLLVPLFLFRYGPPQVRPALTATDGVTAAVMRLALRFAAWMAESILAAILGVNRSQWEASRAMGMTQLQALRRIILPQAARIAAPTLLDCFIDRIRSTSLGVTELMGAAQREAAGSFRHFEAFLLVATVHRVIVEALSLAQRRLERRLQRAFAR